MLNNNNLFEELKKGYLETAELNLAIAEECLEADNEVFEDCEKRLAQEEEPSLNS